MQAQLDEADIEKIFLKGLFESKRITRTFGKDKAKQRKEKQWTLQDKLTLAQVALEGDPQNAGLQATLAIAEVEMKDFLTIKTDWMLEIVQQKWLSVDNLCSTALAATFKQQAQQNEILSLWDEEGNIQTAWEELVGTTRRHFQNLFGTEDSLSEEDIQQVLEAHTTRILEAEMEAMDKGITLEELHYATQQLSQNKMPGREGLPIEFYLPLWDVIGPIFIGGLIDRDQIRQATSAAHSWYFSVVLQEGRSSIGKQQTRNYST